MENKITIVNPELYNRIKSCFVRTVDSDKLDDYMPNGAVKQIGTLEDYPFTSRNVFPFIEMAVLGRECNNDDERKALALKFFMELELRR